MLAQGPQAPAAKEDCGAFLSRFAPLASLEDAEESAGNAAGM